jgi:hypothetical protein
LLAGISLTWKLDILQAQGIISLLKRPISSVLSPGPSKRPRVEQRASSRTANPRQTSGSNVKLEDTINIDDLRVCVALMSSIYLCSREFPKAQRDALDVQIKRAEAEFVKREVSPIVLGPGHTSGGVIDLTDD